MAIRCREKRMDLAVNYKLFSELDIYLSNDTVNFFQSFINEATNWVWPSSNLPYAYMTNEQLAPLNFGEEINNFITECKATVSVLNVPPNSSVPWHIDVQPGRRCVLNCPLKFYTESDTFVCDGSTANAPGQHVYKIPYEERRVYLLNSQRYHTVFNYSDQHRYVISFCTEFLTYDGALHYFKGKNLLGRQW